MGIAAERHQTKPEHRRRPAASSELPSLQTQTDWAQLVPEPEWRIYRAAIDVVRAAEVSFLIGGAFGLACYTGRWRNTKDIDFYLKVEDRERAVAALTGAGFQDYYNTLPYDRAWIYRATREGCIVDLIWSMANQRARVTADWFDFAAPARLRGEALQAIPPEELLWCKLYVLQRDRCDWPDLINLLHAVGPQLDWRRLYRRVGPDRDLLTALRSVFGWLFPEQAAELQRQNQELFSELESLPLCADGDEAQRVRWLDSRPWLAAYQPADQPLKF